MSILVRTTTRTTSLLSRTLAFPDRFRTITTSRFLSQEPLFEPANEEPHQHVVGSSPSSPTPLPPNPATGSPLYYENWRKPISYGSPTLQPLIPADFFTQAPVFDIEQMAHSLDAHRLMDKFAEWTTSQNWVEMKQLFESWVKSLDKNGRPNKPDVNLYNSYLRANIMIGASTSELLDLVGQMGDYDISPNTASYNLVLKAMQLAREDDAAQMLFERMLSSGQESMPDNESYNLVISTLFGSDKNQIDAAFKYVDMTLKSGYELDMKVFADCVRSCVNMRRLDKLVSIIEKCKTMDQNKSLCPTWNMCNYIAEVALQNDNSKLGFYALEFMAKWIARGENTAPSVLISVDEGLIVSALATAGRTYSPTLLDASWTILQQSLRKKKLPNPEAYLGKIYALASLGNLQRAFSTLHEFETAYKDSNKDEENDLFSPFTSLNPLVVACSKKGYETLDSVYFQLENLSRADPPYKSVAALNCIVLGCANTWDLDRAYQTFEAISSTFELTPDIHSYNALMYAFGKLKKTFEATRVFEHLVSLGVKPNATSYSLLIDAHLINRDPKAAVSIVDDMVNAGFVPSKESLKKIRRRCVREFEQDLDEKVVDSIAKKFKIQMGPETRRNMLFNLQYNTQYA